jgi:quinol monooxygenase YgiN
MEYVEPVSKNDLSFSNRDQVAIMTYPSFVHPTECEIWEEVMDKFALLALLQAKAGKEDEVEAFLKSAQPLAERENGTTSWYAVKLGPSKFGIFDTFANEDGRDAHMTGDIAKALFAKAEDLFAVPPQVEQLEILAAKERAA